jgi:HlyD family secretion protein
VGEVFADVNDQVEQGQILAELADNSLPQSVLLARADLVAARKELNELANSNTESAEAYKTLLQVEKDLRVARDDRNRWNYNNSNWTRIYNARQTFLDAEEERKPFQEAFDAVENLPADDEERIQAKQALDEARLKRDKALRNLNYILGKGYDQQVAEDFADYEIALARLEDAQREWERVREGPNKDDISAAEAKVAAAEATVSQAWLESPISGTITRAVPKAGDSVEAGDEGFRIDDLSELTVLIEISEVDVNRIAVGQSAELSFDAIGSTIYEGRVTEVSAVGVDRGSGVVFEVRVVINDPDEFVRPGMTAAVNIVVSEIEDVLIIPNRAIRINNGKRVVYVLSDGELAETEIRTGASSDMQTELLEGVLSEGDVLVLNPPAALQSNGGPPPFVRR